MDSSAETPHPATTAEAEFAAEWRRTRAQLAEMAARLQQLAGSLADLARDLVACEQRLDSLTDLVLGHPAGAGSGDVGPDGRSSEDAIRDRMLERVRTVASRQRAAHSWR